MQDLFDQLPHLKVLLVEDNFKCSEIMNAYFRILGIKPMIVSSANQALRLLRTGKRREALYDIILIDHYLPDMEGITLAERINSNPISSGPLIFLLTPSTQPGSIQKMDRAGIFACLRKPVDISQLAGVFELYLKKENEKPVPNGVILCQPGQTTPQDLPVKTDIFPGLRILLVEDTIANQKAATWMLEKFGCLVDIAANGLEALKMVSQSQYHIVFMDVHMPQMDGLEASRRIRRGEGHGAHIPIIAMTANAMSGDRENCIEAGMDDYISKPVDKLELVEALRKWSGREINIANQKPAMQTPTDQNELEVFNYQEALSRYDDDPEILKSIVDVYIEENQERSEKMLIVFDENDLDSLSRIAHAIKGGASYIGADRLRDTAFELEKAIKNDERKKIKSWVEKIVAEFTAFTQRVRGFNWP